MSGRYRKVAAMTWADMIGCCLENMDGREVVDSTDPYHADECQITMVIVWGKER